MHYQQRIANEALEPKEVAGGLILLFRHIWIIFGSYIRPGG